MKLLRILGIAFGVAVTLGGTVGVGILRTPGLVAAQTGSGWLAMAVWAAGGVFALLAATSIAELAVMIPRAGGFYNYARAAWGDAAGFIAGWCDWLGQAAAIAFAAVTAEDLLAKLGFQLPGAAVALVLVIAALEWLGLRSASIAQRALSFLLALSYLVLAGAALLVAGPPSVLEPVARPASFLGAIAIAVRSVIVTYDGWYSAIYFSEEMKDPARDLPRAMIRGVALVACVYLAINAAMLAVLGVNGLAASDFPALDAARRVFGTRGETVVTLVSLAAMPSLMNAVLLLATRIVYAMGRDNLLPERAADVNRGGTPNVSLTLTTIVVVLLVLSGTFDRLLSLAGFFYAALYSSGFIALFVLRRREPAAARPFRAWLYPWATACVLLLCIGFLVSDAISNPVDALQSAALLAAAVPVYLLLREWRAGQSQGAV